MALDHLAPSEPGASSEVNEGVGKVLIDNSGDERGVGWGEDERVASR